MAGVLVDTCGWTSLVDAGLNLDSALEEVVGEANLLIIEGVREELNSLDKQRKGLLLDLLYRRAETVPAPNVGHTDDSLVSLAIENSWPVLTVDKGLKERLIEAGGSFIEVTSGPSLRLVST
ncbi:MAG: hypothetical protein VYD50_03325 [Candidatus Thermoplasmatota archaeon]|nr:hypothetical protein [Candidatus Thermoplasmatota archaeon]